MDEPDSLAPLQPDYVKVMRISAAISALVLIIAAIVVEILRVLPMGSVITPVLLLGYWWVFVVPKRRFGHMGYDAGDDRLRIVRGYLFYHDSVVPYGRIQHIDVDQGPIERRYDLATLSAHTAGTHGATISLPGLAHADAVALRERIRNHIKAGQR
jgi:uncharacterized protein